ncbi:MAG TPA: methyltransferase domain-containing protein [Acidimicrobiales bacterium]|nr:methyltransferase domain-containing protein [Acidimicrobiales bacterium]
MRPALPLADACSLIVAVDASDEMLRSFGAAAERAGVAHQEIVGAWPDVAEHVPVVDVVVCHHVFYNVANLVPFVEALTAHARSRVVAELTETHPSFDLNPIWRRFQGIEYPPELGEVTTWCASGLATTSPPTTPLRPTTKAVPAVRPTPST